MNSNLLQSSNIICYNLLVSAADYPTHRLDPGELLSNQRLGEPQDAGGLEPGGVGRWAAESAPICRAKKEEKTLKFHHWKKKTKKTTGLGIVVWLIPTSVGGGQQGPLAQLLGDPQQASAEVGGGRGVMAEEGGQAQQVGRLTQALEVLGILGQPRAEHGAHDPAVVGAENINTGPSRPTPTSERRQPAGNSTPLGDSPLRAHY